MRVGQGTGRFILDLIQTYVQLGSVVGEVEQTVLQGHAACPGSHATDHQGLGILLTLCHHTKAQFLKLLHCS